MWYSVSTFAMAERDQSCAEPLWEEQIFLISADSEDEARHKAELLAKGDECGYRVMDGSSVRWKFHCIANVYEIPDEKICDGMEIFSRFLRDSEVNSLLKPFD